MTQSRESQLIEAISLLPSQLEVWQHGPETLRQVLFACSLRRMSEVAGALPAPDVPLHELNFRWRETVATLVEWAAIHPRYGRLGAPTEAAIAKCIRLAQNWHILEMIQVGLGSRELEITRARGRTVWLSTDRSAALEVLDMALAQVTVLPAQIDAPSAQPVIEWFERYRGRTDVINLLPSWMRGLMWLRADALLRAQGTSIPESTDLGGLSLADARSCYAELLATTEINGIATVLLQTPQTVIWHIRPEALLELLSFRVDRSAAAGFIGLLTYGDGRTASTNPLIPSGELFMIPAELLSPIAFERTLLRAAAADPSRAGALGNALGDRSDRWCTRLRTVPGVEVFEKVQMREPSGRVAGDLDVVALDAQDKLALVFETKWPIDAASLTQSLKVDATVASGCRQLARLRDAFESGAAAPQFPAGTASLRDFDVRWWVGSAQQLDSRLRPPGSIGTTSLRLLEHLLPARSLRALDRELREPPLPLEGRDYRVGTGRIQVREWCVFYPRIELLGSLPTPPEDRRIHMGWT